MMLFLEALIIYFFPFFPISAGSFRSSCFSLFFFLNIYFIFTLISFPFAIHIPFHHFYTIHSPLIHFIQSINSFSLIRHCHSIELLIHYYVASIHSFPSILHFHCTDLLVHLLKHSCLYTFILSTALVCPGRKGEGRGDTGEQEGVQLQ